MRKLLAGATFLIVGVGAASNATAQIVSLRGSDTLEDVARGVIAGCTFPAGTGFTYAGGGSGAGQSAMVSVPPTQNIAPMSRELNGTACTATAAQLLIGLDGIAIVGANQGHGDSLETPVGAGGNDLADDCRDSIQGDKSVAIANCAAIGDACDNGVTSGPGTYTFRDWKDVLAVVYGGQNHGTAAQTITNAAADPAHPIQIPLGSKRRNPVRIDCGGELRNTLLNSWGTIFSDTGAPVSCRTGSCNILKHAFRRGDLSGTTDTFVGLVGLIAIPAFTRSVGTGVPGANFPVIDQGTATAPASTATANPFCNAGEQVMNKGDSDYLDLDPIRRIADSDAPTVTVNRLGREQLAEGYGNPALPPAVIGNDTRVQPAIRVLRDWGSSNRQNFGPDPSNPTFAADQAAALALRQGLGVVLPVEMPTNYLDEVTAYWGAGAPVLCTPGVLGATQPDTGNVTMNPDRSTGLTAWPVSIDPPASPASPNYNCLTNTAKPSSVSATGDQRVYNLAVMTVGGAGGGKFVRDTYLNPNLTLPAARQNRVVSAFFRLHTSQNTNYAGAPTQPGTPGSSVCKQFTSTDQIGCLVKASACSVGFAGREAVDKAPNPLNSMAFRLGTTVVANNAFPPSTVRIEHLVDGLGQLPYGLARTLWVNAVTPAAETANEQTLLTCFGKGGASTALVDGQITGFNFVRVPATVARDKSCPAVF